MTFEIKPCRSCGSPGKHTTNGIVNRIECTKCMCRVVSQDLKKVIETWNYNIPKDEPHAVIRCNPEGCQVDIVNAN